MSIELGFFWLLGIYLWLTCFKMALTLIFIKMRAGSMGGQDFDLEVTVLQPILGGDPTLEQNLYENLTHHPRAQFIWLIDRDDSTGREAAMRALRRRKLDLSRPDFSQVEWVDCDRPPAGANPKTFKLELGLQKCRTEFLAVLDDDTILSPGALSRVASQCQSNQIVTGLPHYVCRENATSSLLTGFVNGQALITYPPIAALSFPRTLNGMFYVLRVADLKKLGSFQAILNELCDDYAIACLYRNHGGRVIQSPEIHSIRTKVRDWAHYFSIIRRWMIFTNRFLKKNFSIPVFVLLLIPSFIPLVLIGLSFFCSASAVLYFCFALLIKSLMMNALRSGIASEKWNFGNVFYEVVAELLLPWESLSALFWPQQFKWRSREFRMDQDRIRIISNNCRM